jgi:hypothetical protein|tara:strand:+ start:5970 stop:6161 length:192 start_codon:yes stop_codon:yes gene_type:complete
MSKLEELEAAKDAAYAAYVEVANETGDFYRFFDATPHAAAYDAYDDAREAYRLALKKQQEKTP